jgi:nucleotide-binding universal stress UspA family protein
MKTNRVKKVLIALDYNPTAQKVAEEGYSVASAMNAEITLLHVISDFVYYSSTEYSPIMGFGGFIDMTQLQNESSEGLKTAALSFLDKSRQYLGDKSINILVKEGDFADVILATAKEMKAELIIIGSHSRKWLENLVMGSVTEKVLHHTSIPLCIIPTKKRI